MEIPHNPLVSVEFANNVPECPETAEALACGISAASGRKTRVDDLADYMLWMGHKKGRFFVGHSLEQTDDINAAKQTVLTGQIACLPTYNKTILNAIHNNSGEHNGIGTAGVYEVARYTLTPEEQGGAGFDPDTAIIELDSTQDNDGFYSRYGFEVIGGKGAKYQRYGASALRVLELTGQALER